VRHLGLLVVLLLLYSCTTGQELISSGEIQKGISKQDMRSKFLSSTLSEDPFLPEGGRLYFSDTKTEILYPPSKSYFYIFTNVSKPTKCGNWVCDLGNGYFDSWHVSITAARNYIDENYSNKKKIVTKKKNTKLPKITEPNSSEKIEKLQKLINKFENGNISREEFNKQKKELLKS
tara:strand:+ start:234 stop:761 length:528 start_codon:yes stop_codon:yes gene_type:complete